MQNNFKSGFIALIGRPNVGKSTFINQVVGKKVAIVSDKPQTTRNNILGIKTTDEYQLIFTDTPGVHKGSTKLDDVMENETFSSAKDADMVLFMTTPLKEVLKGDEIILERLKAHHIPAYLVINKVDQLKHFNDIDLTIAKYKDLYDFKGVYPISLKENKNVDILLNDIVKELPLGFKYYPDGQISDHDTPFLVSEIIREKLLYKTEKEIPHSIAVGIDTMKTLEDGSVDILATIYCERDSQKKIIIGKGGEKIKRVKELAKSDIKKLLSKSIHLDLWVKVKKDWKDKPNYLKEFGFDINNYK